jgi:medium-chain acyl-[acyl-carrier-protein] hydrolase
MAPLVSAVADALGKTLVQPYAFFGHSMGALVAFEVSHERRKRGLSLPTRLIVSGRRSPTVPNMEPPLHGLSDRLFVSELVRHYGGIPKVILDDPELLALFVPVLKADFAVFETHHHAERTPLDCAISLYGGKDDPQTAQMDAWADLVTGPSDASCSMVAIFTSPSSAAASQRRWTAVCTDRLCRHRRDLTLDEPQPELSRETWLRQLIASTLAIDPATIDPDSRLHGHGLTSLNAAEVTARMAAATGRSVSPTLLWDYPTLRRLETFLAGEGESTAHVYPDPMAGDDAIAITGIACRFPGADNPDAFWRMLCDGVDAITEVPKRADRLCAGARRAGLDGRYSLFLRAGRGPSGLVV